MPHGVGEQFLHRQIHLEFDIFRKVVLAAETRHFFGEAAELLEVAVQREFRPLLNRLIVSQAQTAFQPSRMDENIGYAHACNRCMKTRSALLMLAFCLAAAAQSDADRTASANATPPERNGIVDKVLAIAGPADPAHLNRKQRFEQYVLNTIGPVPLAGEALGAAINQWADSPAEWGQGWTAYGRRYGSNLGYNAVRQTITYGVSEAFREDTRYFASTASGFWPRTRHALTSTFTSRRDDGHRAFSPANVSGVIGAAAISSLWGPPSWRTADSIAANAAISFAATAGFNVVREFLPDILHRRR
jgi:hypothetical protein